PGYGMSDPLRREPDLGTYGNVICSAVQALDVDSAFFLGHHTGGSIALMIAVQAPETVKAVAIWGFALVDEAARMELANEPAPNYDDDGQTVLEWWEYRRRL